MKLLGAPEVRPDAVFALLNFLSGVEGDLSEKEVCDWMVPALARAAVAQSVVTAERADGLRKRIRSIRDAAAELGYVREGEWKLRKKAPKDRLEFADAVHDALIAAEQWDIVDAYASVVVECDRDPGWMRGMTGAEIATRIRDRLNVPVDGETAVFNKERWSAWTSWTTTIGLGTPGPKDVAAFLPHPARRLRRLLRSRSAPKTSEVPAGEFMSWVAEHMPYLDGGARHLVAWQRTGDRAGAEVSRVLTGALLDLDRQGDIELRYEGGDRRDARQMASISNQPRAFASVRIVGRGHAQ
jgi:hypothetical protein